VHILKSGTTILTATQAGNDSYNAATAVTSTLTVSPTTGIDQVESNAINLNVYPNPVAVTVALSEAGQGAVLRVTDLTGKTLILENLAQGVTTTLIPVANLSKGVYLVNYSDKTSKRAVVKLIKY